MPLDPSTTAVVLIEFQNDFTSEGGVLHGAVADVMGRTGMVANTVRVVEAARAAGVTVMHAPIAFAPGYHEIGAHPYGILKGVVDGNASIILAGFLTNCCVESTMRTGYEHGYQVITLTDGTAATSVEEHDNTLRYDFPMFSRPMTAAEVVAELA